jgi:hypothetical protein
MPISRFIVAAALLASPLWTGAALGAFPDDPARVRPREAASYDARDSHEGITIAAEAYDSDEKIKAAFGKYDPRKFGVLPVYVVFFNTSKDALRLDALEITLERGRTRFPQVPAVEVSRRVNGFKTPNGIKPVKIKSPISSIVDQEFLLKMVPPGETAGGFLYFDRFSAPLSLEGEDARLYLNKIQWAASGKELLFFEIAFKDQSANIKPDTRKP